MDKNLILFSVARSGSLAIYHTIAPYVMSTGFTNTLWEYFNTDFHLRFAYTNENGTIKTGKTGQYMFDYCDQDAGRIEQHNDYRFTNWNLTPDKLREQRFRMLQFYEHQNYFMKASPHFFNNANHIFDWLNPRSQFLCINRRDYMSQFLSIEISVQTGFWHFFQDKEIVNPKPKSLIATREEFDKFWHTKTRFDYYLDLMEDKVVVDYEDIENDITSRITKFLGWQDYHDHVAGTKPPVKNKRSPDEKRGYFQNVDEVEGWFEDVR